MRSLSPGRPLRAIRGPTIPCQRLQAKNHQQPTGELELQVPQTRDSQFYPSTLDRGERSERDLKLALAEMYVQGISTRKVAAITQELCA